MAILKPYKGLVPRIGKNVYLADDVVLVGDVTIEDGASIWWKSVLRGDCGAIVVGAGSNVQDGCVLHSTTGHSVTTIGPNVTVGHRAVLHGATVLEGALIGMNAVVLDLARIGAYSIVAAGSVVLERTEVPPDCLAAGVPARVRRRLDAGDRQARLASAQEYRGLARAYLEQERTDA
jgi:carbonic anhydrase/acetyltransferase-like protein (isoleucine patch superfamily)